MIEPAIVRGVPITLANQQVDANFDDLYQQYADRIYRYVAIRVGTPEEAEDITAQTFLRAYEAMLRGGGGNNPVAWLFGIARNGVADHYRSQPKLVSLNAVPHLASSSAPLEKIVEERDRMDRVAAALKGLSQDRAEVLALRIFGGLSTAEVAEVLNKSRDAVKVLQFRAVQDLQERIGFTEENENEAG